MLNVHRNTLFLCCALPCSPGLAAACSLCAAAWGRAEVSRVGSLHVLKLHRQPHMDSGRLPAWSRLQARPRSMAHTSQPGA